MRAAKCKLTGSLGGNCNRNAGQLLQLLGTAVLAETLRGAPGRGQDERLAIWHVCNLTADQSILLVSGTEGYPNRCFLQEA